MNQYVRDNQLYANGTDGDTKSGNLKLSGAAAAAATGRIRLANTDGVNWRNAANSADLGLSFDGADRPTLSVGSGNITATATGGARTLPANPQDFLTVNINGTAFKIPYWNP